MALTFLTNEDKEVLDEQFVQIKEEFDAQEGVIRCGTNSEWLAVAEPVVKGEVIAYLPDDTRPRPMFKIGDGTTLPKNLPFIDGFSAQSIVKGNSQFNLIDYGSQYGFETIRTDNSDAGTKENIFSPRVTKSTGEITFKTTREKADGTLEPVFQTAWTSYYPREKNVTSAVRAQSINNNDKTLNLIDYASQSALEASFPNQGDGTETYVLDFRLNKADGTIKAKTVSAAGEKLVTLYTAGEQGYRPAAGSIQGLDNHIKSMAVPISQGTEHANKLFYITPGGYVEKLTLGEEFTIINGVLRLTEKIDPAELNVDNSGTATMTDMQITEDGNAVINSGNLVVDADGNATI